MSFLDDLLTKKESKFKFILCAIVSVLIFVLVVVQIALLASEDDVSLYREVFIWEKANSDGLFSTISVDYPFFTVCPTYDENEKSFTIENLECSYNGLLINKMRREISVNGVFLPCWDLRPSNARVSQKEFITCTLNTQGRTIIHFWSPELIIDSPSTDVFDWTVVPSGEKMEIGLQRIDYKQHDDADPSAALYQVSKTISLYSFSNQQFSTQFDIKFLADQVKVYEEYYYKPQYPWALWVGVLGGDILLGILLFYMAWKFILPKIFVVEDSKQPLTSNRDSKFYDTL